ncbi:hypothetical protein DERF_008377 [Dermatophagoides farinae]|uniref:Ig-like domain-containing protein n=1 Tax=Dermatophagoides farinae TaxID=6954 RepID=A0A922L490_DERFA|nr:hypothetical protein DERF_008377 [Dermatophagoides farinae]
MNLFDRSMMIKSIHCEYVLLTEYQSLNLSCKIFNHSSSSSITIVNWYKDQKLIIDSSLSPNNYNRTKFHLINQNDSIIILTLLKAKPIDVGDYECRQIMLLDLNSTKILHIHRFAVRAKPRIRSELFGKNVISQTVWANEEWRMKCSFVSKYHQINSTLDIVRIEEVDDDHHHHNNGNVGGYIFSYDNYTKIKNKTKQWLHRNNDRVQIQLYNMVMAKQQQSSDNNNNNNNQTVIELKISNVNFKDRGYLGCIGINPVANDNLLILLRVNDRIRILCPIIVIITLSLYLFTIITIYEYRRISPFSLLQLD